MRTSKESAGFPQAGETIVDFSDDLCDGHPSQFYMELREICLARCGFVTIDGGQDYFRDSLRLQKYDADARGGGYGAPADHFFHICGSESILM